MFAIPFILYSLIFFPNDSFCHIPMMILSGYEEKRLVHTRRFFGLGEGGSRFYLGTPPCQRAMIANPSFREAPDRKHSPTNEEYRFDTEVHNRLIEYKRLSIYNWNPGPRRGRGAIEKHIEGKWHIITLQESLEHFDHDYLTNRSHVTHYGSCAVLFSKDTFHPDIKVSSVSLHDTRDGQQQVVSEGQSDGSYRCHITCIVSAAATQRQTVLYCNVATHQQPVCQAWYPLDSQDEW